MVLQQTNGIAPPEQSASVLVGESADPLLFVGTVEVAERLVADHLAGRVAAAELLLEDGEELVAPEEVVPQERDASTVDGREPRRSTAGLHPPSRSGPHHVVGRLHAPRLPDGAEQPLAFSDDMAPPE